VAGFRGGGGGWRRGWGWPLAGLGLGLGYYGYSYGACWVPAIGGERYGAIDTNEDVLPPVLGNPPAAEFGGASLLQRQRLLHE
jgi:hypothetical protein